MNASANAKVGFQRCPADIGCTGVAVFTRELHKAAAGDLNAGTIARCPCRTTDAGCAVVCNRPFEADRIADTRRERDVAATHHEQIGSDSFACFATIV